MVPTARRDGRCMTGILGIFERSGEQPATPRLPDLLLEMIGAIRHRATAGTEILHGADVELAGLGTGASATRGGLCAVAAARLDNRADLVRALGGPTTASDTELILLAYERWHEEAPEHLLGDFAFAIWDEPERRLFCARDHVGTQSFYYYLERTHLLFASEIKAILAHAAVPRTLDDGKIADYLGQVHTEKDRTFYAAIRRLPPGHSLTITASSHRLREYWALDPELDSMAIGEEDAAETFRSCLAEALRCRLRPNEPTALLLSGGLDSSTLFGLQQRHRDEWGGSRFCTLSALFPDFPRIDERRFIDLVLAPSEVETHFLSASDTSPLQDVDSMLAAVDEPFGGPNLYIYFALARRARELGLVAIVDGVDGDTTVGHGMEYLAELFRRGRLLRVVRECRLLARTFRQPTRSFLWHYCAAPVLRSFASSVARRLGRGLPRPPATVRGDFATEIAWDTRLRDLLGPRLHPASSHREFHHRALTSPLVPHFLEVHDKTSACFGLQHRHPYFDRRLIELCYRLPAAHRISAGLDRAFQRRAVAGLVPEQIRLRVHKSNWGDQFKHGFLNRDRARIEEIVLEPEPRLLRFVDEHALAATFERCRQGEVTEEDGMNLWFAVTLGLWLRRLPG